MRFPIVLKLSSLIFILGGTAILIGLIALSNLQSLNETLNHAIEVSAEKVRLTYQLKESLLICLRAEKNLILADEIPEMQAYIEEITSVNQEMRLRLEELLLLLEEDEEEQIQQFVILWDQWIQAAVQTQELNLQGEDEQAKQLTQLKGDTIAAQSEEALNAVILKNVKEMEAENLASDRKYAASIFWVTSLTVGGILAGGLASLYIARNIVRNIQRLSQLVMNIQRTNDLSVPVQIQTHDEIRELAEAFDRMRLSLLKSREDLQHANEELEHRVAERTEELMRRNKELDQFAYVASHDLKAPLRAIENLSSWIMEDAYSALPEPSRRHLEQMRNRVDRMENLLNDLLTYSRVGRKDGEILEVDTKALVLHVVELLSPPAEFTIHIQEPMPVLHTARTPLEVVFRNLIGNAVKHHHRADGRIEIQARALAEEGMTEFSVSDDGPGIAPEFHERIFQMFQTLRPRDEVEGSGMGLAIVKKHVENRGGRIEVDSEPGRGTTFRFTWRTHEQNEGE